MSEATKPLSDDAIKLQAQEKQRKDQIQKDKMGHLLFVSYLDEEQTEFQGDINNVTDYKNILHNKIKTIGIKIDVDKVSPSYADIRKNNILNDSNNQTLNHSKKDLIHSNKVCIMQALKKMVNDKDFFKKSVLNRLELEAHLLPKIVKELNNPIILNVYNTPYELEYFRKLFPELQYDVSLETTTKYNLNIILMKDIVDDPCNLFQVSAAAKTTDIIKKHDGVKGVPKIVSIIYNYNHQIQTLSAIDKDTRGDVIPSIYNLKTDCIDVTNAKNETLLQDIYKYAYKKEKKLLNENYYCIQMAKSFFDKIKKDAKGESEEAQKVLAMYSGFEQSITKKYRQNSDFCKRKPSDIGEGKTAKIKKSKVCSKATLMDQQISIKNRKIKEKLKDLIGEIENSLGKENKLGEIEVSLPETEIDKADKLFS